MNTEQCRNLFHPSKYGGLLSICRSQSGYGGECSVWEEEARLVADTRTSSRPGMEPVTLESTISPKSSLRRPVSLLNFLTEHRWVWSLTGASVTAQQLNCSKVPHHRGRQLHGSYRRVLLLIRSAACV